MTIEVPRSIARTVARPTRAQRLSRHRPVNALALLGAAMGCAAAPTAAGASVRLDRVERTIVGRINAERTHRGLPALRASPALSRCARAHSWEMTFGDFFSHSSANGSAWYRRVWRFTRARMIGETIAWVRGGRDGNQAAQVVDSWLRSPPHRYQLLNANYRRVGVGRSTRPGSARLTFVTADFSSAR